MDFTLTDDHLALRDAVRRFCDGEYAAHTRGMPEDDAATARRHAGMAGLGLLGIALPAAHGGSELGSVEAMLVATELGRALAGAGWLANATLAAPLIATAGSATQQDRWLGAIAAGMLRAAVAVEEPQSRWDAFELRTAARATARGWRVDGVKHAVLEADAADLLIVPAATPEGPALFTVAGDAAGLARRALRLLDGRRAAHLVLHDVPAQPLGTPAQAALLIPLALDRANAMLVAECAGAAEALLDLTLEHLRTRRQFGAPLAKFQALQHRVADQAIALEQLKSMACVAALALEDDDVATRSRGVAAAKTLAAQLGRRAALDAIQLHGAMGMTEECPAARYAKRLITNGALFGDALFHRRRFSALRRHHETPGDPA